MKQDYRGYVDAGSDLPYEEWIYERFREELMEQASGEPLEEVDFFDSLEHNGGYQNDKYFAQLRLLLQTIR